VIDHRGKESAARMNPGRPIKRAVRSKLPRWIVDRMEFWRVLWRTHRLSWTAPRRKTPHYLPGPLIVSLTSYPLRFNNLHLTLKSLLNQSVKPDKLVLWIAHGDLPLLPARVRRLERCGVTIRPCEDIGSYKKLIFALEEYPEGFIVTADDDMFYAPRWLEALMSGVDPGEKIIVCHRAHRITIEEDGAIAPYANWKKGAQDVPPLIPSKDLLATGCAGILYPPGSLSPEVSRKELFQQLCSSADDLWFYWMARRAGSTVMKTGAEFPLIEWPSRRPRPSSLWDINRVGGNDQQIKNLEEAFGNPLNF
jgi:hypothetical protein